jgi:hypothetical protein
MEWLSNQQNPRTDKRNCRCRALAITPARFMAYSALLRRVANGRWTPYQK